MELGIRGFCHNQGRTHPGLPSLTSTDTAPRTTGGWRHRSHPLRPLALRLWETRGSRWQQAKRGSGQHHPAPASKGKTRSGKWSDFRGASTPGHPEEHRRACQACFCRARRHGADERGETPPGVQVAPQDWLLPAQVLGLKGQSHSALHVSRMRMEQPCAPTLLSSLLCASSSPSKTPSFQGPGASLQLPEGLCSFA